MSNQLTNGEYSLTLDSLGSLYLPDGVGVLRGVGGASVFMRDDSGPVGIGAAVGYNVVVDISFGVALTANGYTLQVADNGDINFPTGMKIASHGDTPNALNPTRMGHSNGLIFATTENTGIGIVPTTGIDIISETAITLNSITETTTIEVNSNLWTFELDGTINFPNGTRINSVNGVGAFGNDNGVAIGTSNPNCVYVDPINGVAINAEDPTNLGTAKTWNFFPDGNLMIPGGGRLYYSGERTVVAHSHGVSLAASSDVYVTLDNADGFNVNLPNITQDTAVAQATIDGTTMTVTSVTGTLVVGQTISGSVLVEATIIGGIAENTLIVSQLSGDPGGVGTYEISISQDLGVTFEVRASFMHVWSFEETGRTMVPFNVSIPVTSQGAAGDKAGMTAFDSDYMYVCTANWADASPSPQPDIWSRVALDNTAFDYS